MHTISASISVSNTSVSNTPGTNRAASAFPDSASDLPSEFSAGSYSGSYSSGSSDIQLIARVLNGETRAYAEFIERYRRFVYAVLRRADLSAQEREDIYQELYVRLWQRNLRGLRRWQATGMREFKPYLSAVIRRLIYDHYREQWKNRQILCGEKELKAGELPLHIVAAAMRHEEMLDFDGILLRKEQWDTLRLAIARLSRRDADIICRRYFADQSYQEIGAALGITTDNVGVTLGHIRKRLRKHLSTLGIEVFEEYAASQKRRSEARK